MQLKVISLIMAQAKEIYCTLCCDNLDASDPCDLFYTVKKTAKELEIEKEQQAAKAQAKKEAIERKDRLQREAAERAARR